MRICGGMVLDGAEGRFRALDVTVENGVIAALSEHGGGTDIDDRGLYVIPGFIDTHIHGSVGVEFASPDEDFERIFGRRADKRRKLYNGMIKCQLYMYFK